MSTPDLLHADLLLRRPGAGRVGADRIALLRAVRETGSISAAARACDLGYKSAWDAVQVLNNLFDRPLVLAAPGGKDGGVTSVTPAGEAVIAAFAAAEAELADAIHRLEARLSAGDGPDLGALLWGTRMRTSARNALRGTVARVTPGAVNAEVALSVAAGVEIVATVTRDSVAELGLVPGASAIALVKSSFVILARSDDPGDRPIRTSARNCLAGVVTAREDGAVSSEVTLELTLGKTLTATLTRESAEALDLAVGTRALALVKASHVILAVD
ncbi:MAG: TOBE domain-containing protein [Janthinobacterium lividum]